MTLFIGLMLGLFIFFTMMFGIYLKDHGDKSGNVLIWMGVIATAILVLLGIF